MTARPIELVCPAGTPAALRAAVDAGADAVYCGFNDETNARNFPGLNFSPAELEEAIGYAHARRAKVFVAINTFPRAGSQHAWHQAVDCAAAIRADAAIVADIGLLAYAASRHAQLRLHLSVQAAAANPESIAYYVEQFSIKRVVLPRVLTVAEIAAINRSIACETEVFVFGGLCVMAEGRCSMSSYVTGRSPNMNGVCSPPSHVRYVEHGDELVSKLGDFTINQTRRGESNPYPTLCKGRFRCGPTTGNIFEEPASLDASALVPALAAAGVSALKIEGRQRSRNYIETVVREFRTALDRHADGQAIAPLGLTGLTEGQRTTQGAYRKAWR
jgi:O2-independent ubiquinone biosynthesis protein UbiU